jgi:peptidoglycan/LPS O-acetylase OafA/YrhL
MNLPNSNAIKYRADVDGLRALAVLPVLFFHADLGFTGGYVGVDIFFVISGYLITGLLLRDLDAGHFSIVKFWERRVRRIMPALAVVVLASLVAGWFLLLPQGFKELGESAVAQSLLVSNVYFWIKSWIGVGYFTPDAEVKPLLHTWSLAVEEQFYLFFPFLLLALKRLARHSIVPAILLLAGFSFALSVYCSYRYPSANFYLLPTRAWELLIGSFLAAISVQQRIPARWLTESLSWGGLLAILYAVFFYDRETRFPGVSAILPCVGTALVIWTNGHTLNSVGKLLALRPVVFIGLISYSLYLWHWPVLVFAKYWAIDPLSQGQRLLLLLASLILAVISWKFVETPFRQRVIFKSRSQIFTFAGVTTMASLLAGLAIFKSQGVPSRLPAEALRYVNGERRCVFDHDLSMEQAVAGDFIELGNGDARDKPIDLMVWGDSHAMAVMPVIDSLCKEYSVRGVAATHSATAPLLGYQSSKSDLQDKGIHYNKAVVNFIRNQRVRNVIIVANWGVYTIGNKESISLSRGLSDTLDTLQATGAKIWIMRQVPKQPWDVPDALASTVWRGQNTGDLGLPLKEHLQEFQRQSPIFEGISTQYPGVTILDATDLLVTTDLCRVWKDGNALYCDDNHLTTAGAMLLRPLFEPIVGNAKK